MNDILQQAGLMYSYVIVICMSGVVRMDISSNTENISKLWHCMTFMNFRHKTCCL